MSKFKGIIICGFTFLFSYLFYNEAFGINVLCFLLPFLIWLYLENKSKFKDRKVLLLTLGLLLSSFGSWLNGNGIIPFLFLFALIGVIHGKSFLVFGLFNSILNLFAGFIKWMKSKSEGQRKSKYLLKYIIPILIIIVFYSLYRNVNATFAELTKNFTFQNISFLWVLVTLLGFGISVGAKYYISIPFIDKYLSHSKSNSLTDEKKESTWDESFGFSIAFGVINLMLIIINVIDIYAISDLSNFSDGKTLKAFLHKGVGTLMFSIFLGISILLYFFRNQLNFVESSERLKALAKLWIALNILMVGFTVFRNHLYITEALLSYKRIGVYYWLFFATLGLVFTWFKIQQNKTTWYIIERFSNWIFIVLAFSSLPKWDSIISDYNLTRAEAMDDISNVDKSYLLGLSSSNIPDLYQFVNKKGFYYNPSYSQKIVQGHSNKSWLDKKLFKFLVSDKALSWQSDSWLRKDLTKEISLLKNSEKISELELQNLYGVYSLDVLRDFVGLKSLNLTGTRFNNFRDFKSLDALKLEKLLLNNNNIQHLDTLEVGDYLKRLELDNNNIESMTLLNQFHHLDSLSITHNKISQFSNLAGQHEIQYLNLSHNPIKNISNINLLTQLKTLRLNHCSSDAGQLPTLPNLEYLSMNSSIGMYYNAFLDKNQFPKMRTFSCSQNNLRNFEEIEEVFPNLEILDFSMNHVDSLKTFNLSKSLKEINFKSNPLKEIWALSDYKALEILDFTNCDLIDIRALEPLRELTQLFLGNNWSIKEFSSLISNSKLEILDLSQTQFSNLSTLSGLGNLQQLNLIGCRIDHLKGLKNFPKLTKLELSYVNMIDVKYLKTLKSLKTLHLSATDPYVLKQIKKELSNRDVHIIVDEN
ncbi:MAG: DUF4153 domain-containing protein [Flavobacteriales bacterium]